MAEHAFTDEILMAFADGELDVDTARAVEAAAATDPAIAKRIALFRGTGDFLATAAAARATPPVPEALMARVRDTLDAARAEAADDTVLPFAPRTVPQAPEGRWRIAAIAASVALAVGIGSGMLLDRRLAPGTPLTQFAALEAGGVAEALTRLEAGATEPLAAGEISMIASFHSADGTFCREFELAGAARGYVGVACAADGGWELRFAVAGGGADDDGYAPAGALDALDAWLDGTGAGAPLAPEAEAEALRALTD